MQSIEALVKRVIPLALVSALLIVGCNGKKKAPETTTPPSELSPSSTLPPAPPQPPTYIPAEPTTPAVTPAPTAPKAAAPKAVAPKATAPKAVAPKTSTSTKVYVVKKGETLSEIAKAHKTTISKIKAVNPGLNPDKIMAGQKIKLP